mmetsp:Transcript_87305/g.247286  ORF Transcript_87305/g.247286 Transcript_87305/m.247286 type:complete len:503 (-) Transcript_87305:3-1511(-)
MSPPRSARPSVHRSDPPLRGVAAVRAAPVGTAGRARRARWSRASPDAEGRAEEDACSDGERGEGRRASAPPRALAVLLCSGRLRAEHAARRLATRSGLRLCGADSHVLALEEERDVVHGGDHGRLHRLSRMQCQSREDRQRPHVVVAYHYVPLIAGCVQYSEVPRVGAGVVRGDQLEPGDVAATSCRELVIVQLARAPLGVAVRAPHRAGLPAEDDVRAASDVFGDRVACGQRRLDCHVQLGAALPEQGKPRVGVRGLLREHEDLARGLLRGRAHVPPPRGHLQEVARGTIEEDQPLPGDRGGPPRVPQHGDEDLPAAAPIEEVDVVHVRRGVVGVPGGREGVGLQQLPARGIDHGHAAVVRGVGPRPETGYPNLAFEVDRPDRGRERREGHVLRAAARPPELQPGVRGEREASVIELRHPQHARVSFDEARLLQLLRPPWTPLVHPCAEGEGRQAGVGAVPAEHRVLRGRPEGAGQEREERREPHRSRAPLPAGPASRRRP